MPTRVGRTTYTYDAAGRVTQTVTKRISKKPLVTHFYYATGQQPIGCDSSDNPGIGYRYRYDGLGRRVAKETINTTTGETTTRTIFTHAGNHLLAQHDTIGATTGGGFIWTHDPDTGEITGQITLTPTTHTGADAADGAAHSAHHTPGDGDVHSWPQDRVDAEFFAIIADLAGAPQEIIDPDTGDVVGYATHTLYGRRTWNGTQYSPLLFSGQYMDAESGWAYNRFRYYNPHAGVYNAQDPLGATPNTASAQGYVDHAAFWVDVYGLKRCWTKAHHKWAPQEVSGKIVYQQTGIDVFDPHMAVNLPRSLGGGHGTNIDLMRSGRAPIGTDHLPVNLHHIGQDDRSALVEITQTRHTGNHRQLHIFHGMRRNQFPKDVLPVDREAFDQWRNDYWIERATDFND